MRRNMDHGPLSPVKEPDAPGLLVAGPGHDGDEESHVAWILSHVAATRQAILDHGGENGSPLRAEDCVFLSCWDFDGTILKGDCCEGFHLDGEVFYTGLLEETVRAGFSRLYPASDAGVETALDDYARMNHEVGAWIAYPHLALLMAGAREQEVLELARAHFRVSQQRWLFRSSLQMMQRLEASGVEVHVISASPDVYIRAIAGELGWNLLHCRGIRTLIRDGQLSEELDHPVTYADGKTEALLEQVAAVRRAHPQKHVFVLAGFGNNHGTDGHFMAYIAGQKLPAGQPLAVMINVEPAGEDGFVHVSQKAVHETVG